MIDCPKCKRLRRSKIKQFTLTDIKASTFSITEECSVCHTLISHPYIARRHKTKDGYILVTVPTPYPVQQGIRQGCNYWATLPEHRWVYRTIYGPIPKGWQIHHLNGIKDDNRKENLVALPSKLHSGSMQKYGNDHKVKCPHCGKEFLPF